MRRCGARCTLFLLFTCLFLGAAHARTWSFKVGSSGSLKELLRRASPGDTIHVKGVVQEGTLTIDKPLCLIGLNDAVIDGERKGEVLLITASDVTVQGFIIRGTRQSDLDDNAGIKAKECARTTLRRNRLEGCFFAIYLSGSKGALVEDNIIEGGDVDENQMGNGIHLWKCSAATIRGNTIRRHRDGIYFEFVTDSHIERNTSIGNTRYGLHFMFSHRDGYANNLFENNGAGVAVMFSHDISMTNNRFLSNRGGSSYGLLLKEINDGVITGNLFSDNTTGLMVDGCNRIRTEHNVFMLNGWALRLYANASACHFGSNTFKGNTFDLSTNGDLMLNTIAANYWDRYIGYDLDRNGEGDTPYRPLGFFTLLVERMPFAMVFSRSLFVSLLDRAERVIPSLSPEAMKDDRPLMRPPHG
ncbi:MAG: nitrous oxide reductase family maturation protein NosD [Flavobacteriales bacterium]|nr:nitrous oxide reductase family maturation protein NosD [Flavobacteriales bacterium]MBK9287057.1 nitrous oxide reductase family maturation protein NosD [Flavobacteriales bacterium]